MIASLKTVVLEGDLVGDATGLAVAGALKSNRTLINLAVHGDLLGMNIVEEHVLLSALPHIFMGLKRSRIKKSSSGLMSGQLSLAITG